MKKFRKKTNATMSTSFCGRASMHMLLPPPPPP
ncbi:hypothetical protein ISN44_As01g032110, partial [Arabidopsis suecica]